MRFLNRIEKLPVKLALGRVRGKIRQEFVRHCVKVREDHGFVGSLQALGQVVEEVVCRVGILYPLMSAVDNDFPDVLVDVSSAGESGIELNDVTFWHVRVDMGPVSLEVDELMARTRLQQLWGLRGLLDVWALGGGGRG